MLATNQLNQKFYMRTRNLEEYLINCLKQQGEILNLNLYRTLYSDDPDPTDVEIILLKQPSGEKYAIYRSLWDYGFNPTQKDWLYNYVFLSGHISDQMNKDYKLNLHEIFYILKNENGFNLLDDSGKFQSEELQQLYEEAYTIIQKLQTTLSSINAARES